MAATDSEEMSVSRLTTPRPITAGAIRAFPERPVSFSRTDPFGSPLGVPRHGDVHVNAFLRFASAFATATWTPPSSLRGGRTAGSLRPVNHPLQTVNARCSPFGLRSGLLQPG